MGGIDHRAHTYRQLDDESTAIARALTAYGIGQGVRTALMVRPSYALFSITFGLFKVVRFPYSSIRELASSEWGRV